MANRVDAPGGYMRLCVVGSERSGTSAISSLLSIGSEWSLLDDPPESWYTYPLVYMMGYGLPAQLWWKLRRHDIVKVPGFATILPYLRKRFVGDFTALYCLRDPRDVIASVRERLEHGHNPLYTDVTWLGIRVSDPLEAIAWRWRKYLESGLSYRDQGGRIEFVKYEDFYNSRQDTLVGLAETLRIPFEVHRVKHMLDTQFRKSWNSSIAGPGRWERELTSIDVDRIVQICEQPMGLVGYVV